MYVEFHATHGITMHRHIQYKLHKLETVWQDIQVHVNESMQPVFVHWISPSMCALYM